VVPNLWGLWNMLYLSLHPRHHLPIGFHGAILPFLLIPAGVTLARALELTIVTPGLVLTMAPVALIIYYLAWKYLVGYFNDVLGIA
jgi:hypothetical protein